MDGSRSSGGRQALTGPSGVQGRERDSADEDMVERRCSSGSRQWDPELHLQLREAARFDALAVCVPPR
jgi:hypothetical protein